MSDAEVALELLKLVRSECTGVAIETKTKESFLQLYRECLAAVQQADRA